MDQLRQCELFEGPQVFPHGLVYRPEFVTRAEERELLEMIAPFPFREARFQQYVARRRVVHFHAGVEAGGYDRAEFDTFSSGPLPRFLVGLQQQLADWLEIESERFVHALVTEYRPGTPIGWHRDKGTYGIVIGLSLAGWGRMRFRPMDPSARRDRIVVLDLEPRSVYVLQGSIRWQWQHSLLPTRSLRYSITFRTGAEKTPSS